MTSIIDKIRKLQLLAERAGTEAEASAAMACVQSLLLKHNLDLGSVVLKEDPGATLVAGRAWARIPIHGSMLASACETIFNVRHCFSGYRRSWTFMFIGLKANVEAACLTYEYLFASVEALARGAKTANLIYGSEEFVAFKLGAATRIRDAATEEKKRALVLNPGYQELVHIGDALAQRLLDGLHPKGVRGGYGGMFSFGTEAYSHGYEQGARVDLHGARTNRMLEE